MAVDILHPDYHWRHDKRCCDLVLPRDARDGCFAEKKQNCLINGWRSFEAAGVYGVQVPGEEDGASVKTMRIQWKIGVEEKQANLATMIQTSLLRPFQLLFTKPVVFFFSLWAAFSWSVLYINLSAIPLIFETTYRFSLSNSNAIFAASCIGTLLMTVLSILQENATARQKSWNSVPKHRLYFSCIESICLPVGLFIFGTSTGLYWPLLLGFQRLVFSQFIYPCLITWRIVIISMRAPLLLRRVSVGICLGGFSRWFRGSFSVILLMGQQGVCWVVLGLR